MRIMFFPAQKRLLEQGIAVGEMPVKTALGNPHMLGQGFDSNGPDALEGNQVQGLLLPVTRAERRPFFLLFCFGLRHGLRLYMNLVSKG